MGRSVLILLCFFLSLAGTGLYIRIAKRKDIMDLPNSRSSHTDPTPRGGGVVFSGLFLLIVLASLVFFPEGNHPFLLAQLSGGTIIAITGWVEDVKGLTPKIRLGIQFLAVAIALFIMGGFPSLDLGIVTLPLGIIGSLLALVGGVWLVNLYNFMDGIDGLAAGEAVIVSIAGGLIMMEGGETSTSYMLFALAALVGGFLVWNWAPAKVFMGDVGSGFLGYVFAVCAFAGERSGSAPALIWAVLLSVFIVDATLTLLKRIGERKNLARAHRDHLYQQALIDFQSHCPVTLTALVLTSAAALATMAFFQNPFPLFLATYVLMITGWFILYSRFGRPDRANRRGGS